MSESTTTPYRVKNVSHRSGAEDLARVKIWCRAGFTIFGPHPIGEYACGLKRAATTHFPEGFPALPQDFKQDSGSHSIA